MFKDYEKDIKRLLGRDPAAELPIYALYWTDFFLSGGAAVGALRFLEKPESKVVRWGFPENMTANSDNMWDAILAGAGPSIKKVALGFALLAENEMKEKARAERAAAIKTADGVIDFEKLKNDAEKERKALGNFPVETMTEFKSVLDVQGAALIIDLLGGEKFDEAPDLCCFEVFADGRFAFMGGTLADCKETRHRLAQIYQKTSEALMETGNSGPTE